MFIFLDKKREKFNQWLKRKTTIDFSDWSVLILFILGLFAIFFLSQGADLLNRISIIVLWFTAIAILQYTKETYWLKQINTKQYNFQRMPFVILNYEEEPGKKKVFYLKNVGQGVARNIKIRPIIHTNLKRVNVDAVTFPPKTVITPNGGYTYISPVITDDMLQKSQMDRGRLMNEIIEAIKPKLGRHIDLKIEIIYEDAFGTAHKTIVVTSEFGDGYHVEKYE